MAAAVVQTQPRLPRPHFKPVIEQFVLKRQTKPNFDPKERLAYERPKEIIMMRDIGFSEDTGISPVAVSEPFSLFSAKAIHIFRDEVLSEDVIKNCGYKSNIGCMPAERLYSKVSRHRYAPFIYDAWNNAETLAIISKIAGIELIPNMNFEIGHINISVKSEKESREELVVVEQEKKSYANDEGISGCPWEDDKPVVGWHTDSFPFVCVTMLSDCTNMVGGEIALRTGTGDVMKVRGPQMGCAVVMQGRYITHQALRALGARERITMVTSFRPKSPQVADDTVLSTVRGISDLSELYYEFGLYRLEMLEERIRYQLKRIHDAHAAGKKTDTRGLKKFLAEQEKFLQRTNEEMIQDEDVVAGKQPELDIPNAMTPSVPTPPPTPESRDSSLKRVRFM